MNRLLQKGLIFADIVLSKEDVEAIDKSLEQTDNDDNHAALNRFPLSSRNLYFSKSSL